MYDVVIRTVNAGDREEWLRMRLALWPDDSPDRHRAEIDEFLLTGAHFSTFVAERPGGGLGGFLEASLRPYADGCETKPVGYIEGWYVDPDLRRSGVGGALVRAAEAWARDQGCVEMGSDCLIDNETSRLAHIALGYLEGERIITFHRQIRPPGKDIQTKDSA